MQTGAELRRLFTQTVRSASCPAFAALRRTVKKMMVMQEIVQQAHHVDMAPLKDMGMVMTEWSAMYTALDFELVTFHSDREIFLCHKVAC